MVHVTMFPKLVFVDVVSTRTRPNEMLHFFVLRHQRKLPFRQLTSFILNRRIPGN
jgi:hypothetical protein